MPRSLPATPNMELLRKQAKHLLRAHKDGSPSCILQLRALTRMKGMLDEEILRAELKLAEAQHALALDYGFKGWKELATHVSNREAQHMNLLRQTDAEIAARVQPMIEAMFSGIDQDDYERSTSSFSTQFKTRFTRETFQKQRGYCYPLMGDLTQVTFCELHRGQNDVYALWHLQCEKQDRALLASSRFVEENGSLVLDHVQLLSSLE